MSRSTTGGAEMPYYRVSVWCVSRVVYFVFLLALTKDSVEAQGTKNPSTEFSRHQIVRPTIHHGSGRTRRELSTTRDKDGLHHRELTLTVDVDGRDYVLDLRLNEDLITGDHVVQYQKNGETVQHRPSLKELDICQYSGTVRGVPDSWAAVSTCGGVSGVIYDGRTTRYIEPSEEKLDSHHYLYDHNDLTTQSSCGYAGGVTTNKQYDPALFDKYHREREIARTRASRYKRDTEDEILVRGPYNSNKLSRYVELVLVSDHEDFLASGASVPAVHARLKHLTNIMNSIYAPLNIFIALVGVVIWTERDEIRLLEDGDETLSRFLEYRRYKLIPQIPNDNAQLITRQKFSNGIVGKALKGPMCTYELSGAIATNHTEVLGLMAVTLCHEMGHNFGLEHDTLEDCTCPEEKCIMSPSSTSVMPTHWSSCSLKSLALSFERGMDYCLRNKPTRLFGSPTCGNGFVEPGEQCDCGTGHTGRTGTDRTGRTGTGTDRTDGTDRTEGGACAACCHPDTCQLRANATCATGECCDFTTCRPKSAGTECRSADRECDLPEYCSGHSEYCPADVFRMDATPCGRNHEAYCMKGSCRSHTDQCRLLWGTTGEMAHPYCYYNINMKNNTQGNCGYNRMTQTFVACAAGDGICGLLHCRHLNEQLEFGMESVSKLTHTFINNNGSIAPCRAAMVDLGLNQTDPGLVPDGAKCGHERMCLKQKCVSVSSVREAIARRDTSVCPSDCSNHGVCNSEGHCHCEVGFAPPLCAAPGAGGSLDSGPASDLSAQRNFMVAMYVIFLGIIPSILLLLFLIYYSNHNVLRWWRKPKKIIQSPNKSSLQRRISRGASKFAANFHSNNSQTNAPPVNVHTLSSPDDMSSSLLRSDSDRSPAGNVNPSVNFFGNFKGFSLAPVEKKSSQEEVAIINDTKVDKSAKITPVHRSGSNSQSLMSQGILKPVLRSAPPLPVVPNTVKSNSPKASPTVKRANSSVQNRIKALMNNEKQEDIKPHVNNPVPRPVISSPILEASTCTAKELISPLQGSKTLGPNRSAPGIPATIDLPKRPLSMHSTINAPQKPLPEEPKKPKEGISLNRIASFLKPDKPKERNPVERSNSLPKNPNHQIKVPKTVDKVVLRNLQISNPILLKQIDFPGNTVPVVSDSEDGDDGKSFVNRTQSMRGPAATPKPTIQSFGSMRQAPGTTRPVSIVGRPTAPPPPLPKEKLSATYQTPKPQVDIKPSDYVDCMEDKQAPLSHIDEEGDNIYAIIEESPEKHSKPLPGVPPPIKTVPQPPPVGYNAPKLISSVHSTSTESVGLLGEIVNEIQNRNLDSIYSTATIARKKKEREKQNAEGDRDSTYMNAGYKTPESVYSNSGAKSNVSTTSSGYLHPSAVNVPTFLNKESDSKNESEEKAPPSPTLKVNSKIPTFSRQVTPPGLKNTSSFRNVPQSPKNVPKNIAQKPVLPNSPDVVSSCALPDTKTKPPDVINNNKVTSDTPKIVVKNNVTNKLNDNARPPLKATTVNDKKPIKVTPPLKPTNSSTNLKNEKSQTPLNRVNSKVDSNIKAITDNLNKNKPKIVPKPTAISVQRTDSNVKTAANKLAAKPSNVASLQQKFENRKSFGREPATVKK